MSVVSINNCQTIDELVRWKMQVDSLLSGLVWYQHQLTSAMATSSSASINSADIQFRFDSRMKELTEIEKGTG